MVFQILLKITHRNASEFAEMGVVVTDDPNPIFAVVIRPEAWSKLHEFFHPDK